ncbi:hypothetical protein HRbin19_00140 [bacterium HR19]|nr:hypothetical protein HRbin19_00140 [bacterium HR19]
MKKCLYNLFSCSIALILPFLISRCSSLGERDRGIRFASQGKWDDAISLLEKYVKDKIQKEPIKSKIPLSATYKVPEFYELTEKEKDEMIDFLYGLYYLLASYLGKAGFDERELIEQIIKLKDVDVSNKDEKEANKEMSQIAKDMLKNHDKEKLKEFLFLCFKAQRLYEEVFYGNTRNLDNPNPNLKLENLGELDPQNDQKLKEINRLINSIEFLGGKILTRKFVVESVILNHPDYYLGEKKDKLPSMCCILKNEYPYRTTQHSLENMMVNVIYGIDLILYGGVKEETFQKASSNYSELVSDLKDKFVKRVMSECQRASKKFADFLTNQVDIPEKQKTNFVMEINQNGIWLCPREENFVDEFLDEFSCRTTNFIPQIQKELKGRVRPLLHIDVAVRRQNETKYKNCDGQEIGETDLKTLTLKYILDQDADINAVLSELCQKIEFAKPLTKTISEIEKENQNSIFKKAIENYNSAISSIFNLRDEPEECSAEKK